MIFFKKNDEEGKGDKKDGGKADGMGVGWCKEEVWVVENRNAFSFFKEFILKLLFL